MSDVVALKIGGRVYAGWLAIGVEFDLDAGASSFDLGVTERWQGQPDRWAIEAGAACEVTIGGETVIRGYVDALESSLDGESHKISVRGRSKAADLVDCSAIHKPGSWRGRKLEQIAIELVEPFGLAVHVRADTGKVFRSFALQQGETVWAALQRLAAHRGLLIGSTPAGDVEIFSPRPSGESVRLVQGVHPLSISGKHDVSERHSEYLVKGQSSGDDQHHGRAAAGARGEARDPAVARYRPLLIVAEDQADAATCKRRAEWEATVRAAKAQEVTIVLPGWRTAGGALWQPQQAVDVTAPAAWMAGPLMVAGVKLELGEQGRRVTLRIVRPEAYTQLPVPEEAESSRVRRGDRRTRRRRDREDADQRTERTGR